MSVVKKIILPAFVIIALLAVIKILWWGYDDPRIGIDDANIYFVYMRNVAEGHGFVWNVGGEHVEGFTSLLWTIIGAAAYRISPTGFTGLLLAITFTLTFFTLLKVLRYARKLNGTNDDAITPSDIIILSLLSFSLGFVDWNVVTLMETGLWTFLLTSTVLYLSDYLLFRERSNLYRIAGMLVLLDLTRPESIAFGLLFVAIIFLIGWLSGRFMSGLKAALVPGIVHAATIAGLMLWRLSYFGYPFPNTYYAKVSARFTDNLKGGIPYLFTFFYGYPISVLVVMVLLLFSLVIGLKIWRSRNFRAAASYEKVTLLFTAFICAGLLLPVITGGDHFKYSRFYQPVLPIMFLAVCNKNCWRDDLGLQLPTGNIAKYGLALCIFMTSLFTSKFSFFEFFAAKQHVVHYPVIGDFEVAKLGREAGHNLNETFDSTGQYPSVGVLGTGAVGFSYKGKTIDLLGLNNTLMAHATTVKTGMRNHAAFDKTAFYQLRPDMMGTFYGGDVVVRDTSNFVMPENLVSFRTDNTNMVYTCYKQIYDDSAFHVVYIPALIRNKKKDFYLFNYFNRDYLQRLDTTKFELKKLSRKYPAVD